MRLSYEYIKEYIESYGYKLLSKEYIKSNIRLDMICEKGHICSISWDNFKYGRRCKTCANIIKADKFKLHYEEVIQFIENEGCELISKEYINNSSNLLIKCECGNIFERSFANFKHVNRCEKCKERKSKKHTLEYIKMFVENTGYTLISQEYLNANEKIKVRCDKNHPAYWVKFSNFYSGRRCPYCGGSRKPSIEEVKLEFKGHGYKCLSEKYINTKQKLDIICDKGHKTKITLREFRSGCRCNICRNSKGEIAIRDFLLDINVKFIHDKPYFNDLLSDSNNPLRPDFILPEQKIWIEYDGEFHYKKMYEGQNYEILKYHDKLKDEYAKKHGWKMIRIPYWDFDNIEKILKENI